MATVREAAEIPGVSVFEVRRMVVSGDVWSEKMDDPLYLDRREIKKKAPAA